MSAPPAARPRITGLGLVTPAGPNARATCLALRAGIPRFADLPRYWVAGEDEDEAAVVQGARIPDDLPVEPGLEPIVSHARRALREALDDAQLDPRGKRVRLFLGHDPGHDPAHLVAALSAELPGAPRPALRPAGRCAALVALGSALGALAGGELDAAIVGGADQWVSPGRLAALARLERLRTGERGDGVLPGEAAGFVVIEPRDAARARGVRPYARVAGAGLAQEPTAGTEEPCEGAGLTAAFRGALGSAEPRGGRRRLPLCVSDFWGDHHGSIEIGLAHTRALPRCEGDFVHWHAADCIGDTGAGSGAVSLAWAATAFREGWTGFREALVWGVSDGPERAAALLLPEGGEA